MYFLLMIFRSTDAGTDAKEKNGGPSYKSSSRLPPPPPPPSNIFEPTKKNIFIGNNSDLVGKKRDVIISSKPASFNTDVIVQSFSVNLCQFFYRL